MSGLEDLFVIPKTDHPKLRVWSSKLSTGAAASVEIRRARDGIMVGHPVLHIEFSWPDGRLESDSTEWERGLDEALIEKEIKARSLAAEAERLAVRMTSLFAPIVTRYGDDYFNSVLISLLRDMGVAKALEVQDVLAQITSYDPSRSRHFDDCRDDIKAALAAVLQSLTEHLKYSRSEATDIVTAALVTFLDERFSVTSRQILGWSNKPRIGFWSLIRDLAPSLPGKPELPWTASAVDIATALRAAGLDTTSVTVERELLEHATDDPHFPWTVSFEPQTRKLVFEPKKK